MIAVSEIVENIQDVLETSCRTLKEVKPSNVLDIWLGRVDQDYETLRTQIENLKVFFASLDIPEIESLDQNNTQINLCIETVRNHINSLELASNTSIHVAYQLVIRLLKRDIENDLEKLVVLYENPMELDESAKETPIITSSLNSQVLIKLEKMDKGLLSLTEKLHDTSCIENVTEIQELVQTTRRMLGGGKRLAKLNDTEEEKVVYELSFSKLKRKTPLSDLYYRVNVQCKSKKINDVGSMSTTISEEKFEPIFTGLQKNSFFRNTPEKSSITQTVSQTEFHSLRKKLANESVFMIDELTPNH